MEVSTGDTGPQNPLNLVSVGSQGNERGLGNILREKKSEAISRMGQAGSIPGRGRTGARDLRPKGAGSSWDTRVATCMGAGGTWDRGGQRPGWETTARTSPEDGREPLAGGRGDDV